MRGALGITPRKDRYVGGRGESLRTAYTCEGSGKKGTGALRLECPAGAGTLRIAAAMYGRLDKTTCPHASVDEAGPDENGLMFPTTAAENTRRCHTAAHLAMADLECNDKQKCVLRATNEVHGGDPCPGLRKYFFVLFTCTNIDTGRHREQHKLEHETRQNQARHSEQQQEEEEQRAASHKPNMARNWWQSATARSGRLCLSSDGPSCALVNERL